MVNKRKNKDITHNIYLHATRNSLFGMVLIGLALYIGMCGYHYLEHLAWVDSFSEVGMSNRRRAAIVCASKKYFVRCDKIGSVWALRRGISGLGEVHAKCLTLYEMRPILQQYKQVWPRQREGRHPFVTPFLIQVAQSTANGQL